MSIWDDIDDFFHNVGHETTQALDKTWDVSRHFAKGVGDLTTLDQEGFKKNMKKTGDATLNLGNYEWANKDDNNIPERTDTTLSPEDEERQKRLLAIEQYRRQQQLTPGSSSFNNRTRRTLNTTSLSNQTTLTG